MPKLRIDDLEVGRKDSAGNTIVCMYAKKPPSYAVYREPMKVVVHFAEDPRREAKQRAALACLNPLRGQISGLIDGWRTTKHDLRELEDDHENAGFFKRLSLRPRLGRIRRNKGRADRYDRRVADAMVMGLEGGTSDAVALLTEIRDEVKAERESIAETDYLLWAGLAGLVFMGAIWLISSIAVIPNPPDKLNLVWTGAGVGVLGAFFSIATGLRNRAILIDLQKWDNRRDAILRIAVGTIGAGIVLSLILAQLVSITGITDTLNDARTAVTMASVIGFLAGFSERAVGNLLATATGTLTGERKVEDVAAAQARAAAQPGGAVAAAAAAAVAVEAEFAEDAAAPADHPEVGVDACLCDAPPLDSEVLTKDEDLPVAVGGVSADVVAPDMAPAPVAEGVEQQAMQIIQETAVAPVPEEGAAEPGKPKADIPAE